MGLCKDCGEHGAYCYQCPRKPAPKLTVGQAITNENARLLAKGDIVHVPDDFGGVDLTYWGHDGETHLVEDDGEPFVVFFDLSDVRFVRRPTDRPEREGEVLDLSRVNETDRCPYEGPCPCCDTANPQPLGGEYGGLIERLTRVEPTSTTIYRGQHPNPDGPEAAKADLQGALETAREFIKGNFVMGPVDGRTNAGKVVDQIAQALSTTPGMKESGNG